MRLALLLAIACTGDDPTPVPTPVPTPAPIDVRFASFNTSLHRDAAGALITDLGDPTHLQAVRIASILQELRPDVVLLAEVDRDDAGEAIALLQSNFLSVGQDGREPLTYEHVYIPPTNTGLASGIDLDGDGTATTMPGSIAYGNDSYGFGEYPGQYGFAVLSMHPIDTEAIRTFQTTLWKDMPDNLIPPDHYSPEALDVFRLSSKNHADVPIQVGDSVVHFLVSHPTPPAFDGPEDRNGRRNADEIHFWRTYLDGDATSWHTDDAGVQGGLDGASFVIAGDLNNDPADADRPAMAELIAHARVHDPEPTSEGGTEAASQGGANDGHAGDPALDTADFSDSSVGNLRVDFVLPSVDLPVQDSGVFWPTNDDPLFDLIGRWPATVSDHRPVWVDLQVPQ